MDIPVSITPDRAKWPLKRVHPPQIQLEGEPPLTVEDNRVSLAIEAPLAINNTKLGLASAYATYCSVTSVFKSGDLGSVFFRIPSILVLKNGDILVCCDARYVQRNDFGRTATVVAISSDGGLTFPYKTVAVERPRVTNLSRTLDPCVVQAPNGNIFIFTVYFQNSNHMANADPDYDFFVSVSEDGGYTWGTAVSLKHFRTGDEKYFFQCPGTGIVLTTGVIVIPCQGWFTNGQFRTSFIYSTDLGLTWIRSRTAPQENTSEGCVAEVVNGTIMLIAKREAATNNVDARVRAVYTTSDLGNTWEPHRTNNTLRMRNPCQASCFTILSRNSPNIVLFCSPLVDSPDGSAGRSYLTLQYFDNTMTEWRPIGLVERAATYGYTGIAMDPKTRKLMIVTEHVTSIKLHDVSRYWPLITQSMWSDVNLGTLVTATNCILKQEYTPLRYRLRGLDIYLAGIVFKPESGTFPDTKLPLFQFTLPCGVSSRYGWITAFGSKDFPATHQYPVMLEYRCQDSAVVVYAMNGTLSADGSKLSTMTCLYIPDCKICVMC